MKISQLIYLIISFKYGNSLISFIDWKALFNVVYVDLNSENIYRQAFDMNSAFVTLVNQNLNPKFNLDLNKFADLTFDMFKKSYLGVVMPNATERQSKSYGRIGVGGGMSTILNLPASIDYRSVSLPVQDQFNCGSCWAFSVAYILESRLKMKDPSYNTLLSEQHFVDCDFLNYGCYGGWPYSTLYWLVVYGKNAVSSLSVYPYVGKEQSCQTKSTIPMNIGSIVQNETAGNELMMKELVANVGPISVAIDSTEYFQLYSNGILNDPSCDKTCNSVNHAVVIVGYGTNSSTNQDFWIVKNSWGTSWGEQGYIYMSRNAQNQCNIACWAMYAV